MGYRSTDYRPPVSITDLTYKSSFSIIDPPRNFLSRTNAFNSVPLQATPLHAAFAALHCGTNFILYILYQKQELGAQTNTQATIGNKHHTKSIKKIQTIMTKPIFANAVNLVILSTLFMKPATTGTVNPVSAGLFSDIVEVRFKTHTAHVFVNV